jgi:hypothetical protein
LIAARFVLPLGGMLTNQDEIDRLTERVIGCAIEVHRTLGPGLLESIYRECMLIELSEQGMTTEREITVPVDYKPPPSHPATI